jgi:hypothetical protein
VTALVMLVVFAISEENPEELARQLAGVKRIYVDRLTGGEAADQIRDMLMSALQGSKRWIITENPEKADAFLRGAAEDMIYTESRESHDGIVARANLGLADGTYSRSNRQGERSARSIGAGVGANEGQRATERKHEASAALRLVNKDGDLIWATTKESSGAKFRGAASDVADQVVKQLVRDFDAARLPAKGAPQK